MLSKPTGRPRNDFPAQREAQPRTSSCGTQPRTDFPAQREAQPRTSSCGTQPRNDFPAQREKRSLARQFMIHNHETTFLPNERSAASHVKLWHTTTTSMALGILALLQDIAAGRPRNDFPTQREAQPRTSSCGTQPRQVWHWEYLHFYKILRLISTTSYLKGLNMR